MSVLTREAKDGKDKRHRRTVKTTESSPLSPESKRQKASDTKQVSSSSVRTLFYQEEHEAASRSLPDDLHLHKNTCAELRRVMLEIKNIKDQGSKPETASNLEELRIHGTLQFVTLRKLNRLAHFRCKKVRETTSEAKQQIDLHHLKLQNLLYEMMHLQKEINKCLDFKSKDEDIDLVDKETFYQNAPETISKPMITKNDTHQLTLARLDYELDQRMKLSEQFKAACKQKEDVSEEIKTKREYLEGLQPKLTTILQVTKPVQEYLGMPFDEVREQHRTACYLPRPLYVLYMQATAYRTACDKYISASICGDVEVAKAMESTSLDLDDEDEDSDQEEAEKDSQQHHRRSSSGDVLLSRRQKALLKHPLSIQLSITCRDGTILTLSFYFLVALEIVTVDIKLSNKPDSASSGVAADDLLEAHGLLQCLYPDDYGTDTPNPSNKYPLQKLGMGEFSQYVSEAGHPYLWAQWLCGLQFLTLTTKGDARTSSALHPQGSLSAIHMEATVKKLRKRIRARMSLQRQLVALEEGRVAVSTDYVHLFPAKITSTLTQWKPITWADFLASPDRRPLTEAGLAHSEDFYFRGVVVRGSARLIALVILAPDYPVMPPFFSLKVEWKGHTQSVKDMEAEVNIHCHELVRGKSHDELLTNQMQRLLMCFDVYLETEGATVNAEFPREKIYSRTTRGPSRVKPYKFNSQMGFFSQR